MIACRWVFATSGGQRFFPSPLFLLGSRRLLGAGTVSTVGLAVDLDNDRAVYYSIQHAHRQLRVPQVGLPSVEVDIGHDGRRTPLSPVDDLEQQAGRLRRFAPFDL